MSGGGVAGRDNKGDDFRVHGRAGEHDGHVGNTRMGLQGRLDLADFHPIPAYLDHAILAAEELVVAAIKEGNAVTGAIRPAVLRRLSPVTEHHGRSVHNQFAFLGWPGRGPVGALGPYPVPRARFADRD